MGQPVTVVKQSASRPGVLRISTNRVLSGMAHESYTEAPDPLADRPVDEIARQLFATGDVESVHVNGNVITVQLARGDGEGLSAIVEDLFTHYRPGVPVPNPSDFMTDDDAGDDSSAG